MLNSSRNWCWALRAVRCSYYAIIMQGRLLVLDFGPFAPVTDGILFSWDELLHNESELQ